MNIKLVLDFVPNHSAVDTFLLGQNPEYFIRSFFKDPQRQTLNGFHYGAMINSKAWVDTLQFNLFNPKCVEARIKDLERVAELSDGARCDVAHFAL